MCTDGMGNALDEDIKGVEDDEGHGMLDLIYTHIYDEVEINTTVPWPELPSTTQALAKKVVDYYRMQASIKVDAQVSIRSINIEDPDTESGMAFYVLATVEPLGDNPIDLEELFSQGDDDGDQP